MLHYTCEACKENESAFTWINKQICEECFTKHCSDDYEHDLYELFDIDPESFVPVTCMNCGTLITEELARKRKTKEGTDEYLCPDCYDFLGGDYE